ncbi:MAG: type II secretion system F family protein [Epsilonproteobacteria bacterium]|nr:type II secretion system F family protein [Campylobacterota bacterium]
MTFKYVGFDKNGNKIKGTIHATSLQEAKQKLASLTILEIKSSLNFHLKRNVQKKDLAKIFQILALYLQSTIPLIQAIELTKQQIQDGVLLRFLDFVAEEIKNGKSLNYAISNQNIINIPSYITGLIKVAEESAKLDDILLLVAKFLKEEDKLSSKITQALIYPSFIVVVCVFLVSFMLTTIVPKITQIFADTHQQLPPITKFVIDLSHFLQNHYLAMLSSVVGVVFVMVLLYKKMYKIRLLTHRMLLGIPFINRLIITKELGKFSYLVNILSSTFDYINAIKLATNTIENEHIKQIFQSAIKDVENGAKLYVALKSAGFDFDQSFTQAIMLAEETGKIREIFESLSEIYFEESQDKINMFLSLLEPMLILIVGAVVGVIIVAMLLPMFSLNAGM